LLRTSTGTLHKGSSITSRSPPAISSSSRDLRAASLNFLATPRIHSSSSSGIRLSRLAAICRMFCSAASRMQLLVFEDVRTHYLRLTVCLLFVFFHPLFFVLFFLFFLKSFVVDCGFYVYERIDTLCHIFNISMFSILDCTHRFTSGGF
jgi:hypothetical protein